MMAMVMPVVMMTMIAVMTVLVAAAIRPVLMVVMMVMVVLVFLKEGGLQLQNAIEIERAGKRSGSSLEAAPMVYVSDPDLFAALIEIDLPEICITSAGTLVEGEGPADAFRVPETKGVAVVVHRAEGRKCARSWKILPTVGDDPEYPDVTPRDAQALREWKALGRTV